MYTVIFPTAAEHRWKWHADITTLRESNNQVTIFINLSTCILSWTRTESRTIAILCIGPWHEKLRICATRETQQDWEIQNYRRMQSLDWLSA